MSLVRFRGSAAHNTIRLDGGDQAIPNGPFGWIGQPKVSVRHWESSPQQDYLDAQCEYAGFTHRRVVMFAKPDLLLILDEVSGPAGEHDIEQFWHLASQHAVQRIVLADSTELIESWA